VEALVPRSRRAFHDLTPEAYAITLYDPQFAIWASLLQRGHNPSYVRDHACFVLAFEAQHDDAGLLIGRVCTNVGKVQIQSQQDSAFAPYSRSNPLVVRTHQALVPNGFGVQATLSKRRCGFGG
jgi:hypothetical protein